MFKLTKVDASKNMYFIKYKVAHTDVYEHDTWFDCPPIQIPSVSNLEQLADYYRCFKIVEDIIENIGRKGHGDAANYLPFDNCVEEDQDKEHGISKVEWFQDEGVLFTMKDGVEHFIHVATDIGMPREDGHFLEGLKFIYFIYFDEKGNEFKMDIDQQTHL